MIWRTCSFRSSFFFRLSVKPRICPGNPNPRLSGSLRPRFIRKTLPFRGRVVILTHLSVKHPLSPDKIELLLVSVGFGWLRECLRGCLRKCLREVAVGESWPDVFQQKSRPGVVVFCSPRPVSEGLWADQALPLSGPLPLVPRAVSPPRANSRR